MTPSNPPIVPSGPRAERTTQNRIVQLFTTPETDGGLGYAYLGHWRQRDNNRNIEAELLTANLARRGYSNAHISSALHQLQKTADTVGRSLYEANQSTYNLLRYGAKVQIAAGQPHETVHFVDWQHPQNNDFGLAEEVTLKGAQKDAHKRRPDLVLYINGIAIGVLELKRSSVDVGDAIRQLISNQEGQFNRAFFSTVQFLFAGNDSQGLYYGTIGTPEKFFVQWKDEEGRSAAEPGALLDKPLSQMCGKERLIDLMYHCIIFDAGIKKVPRPHQYFGIKAAQERIRQREGGVIWHTQGSGKSILMVLIAKWLMEHDPHARVLILTDRDELDRQIEGVMRNAGVIGTETPSPRITSRKALVEKLTATTPRLLCALMHKFDSDLQGEPPPIYGRFYIFVDECHRTQSGSMHRQMKRWMQDAIFIGFTGTPLLRKDKQTTREMFGTYIHTYKFYQGVADRVILDLKYEARNVPQHLASREHVDAWFERVTRNLNNFQKAKLRKHWATMEALMSSNERKNRITASIEYDFLIRPRLSNDRGTALLVAASIYDACHYFRLFQPTRLGPYCGIITSYEPNYSEMSTESANSDERYIFDTYTRHVLQDGQNTERYEQETKRRFINEPANCKLLIEEDKLLTGFDAPSCTYIYFDAKRRDHGLFQAICRTNRLDGDDKDYGYIVDFKELFGNVQQALAVYNSEELDTDQGSDAENNVRLKDRLQEGKAVLDTAREALKYLCEPVAAPYQVEQYLHYFCGDASLPNALHDTEALRISFYKAVAKFVRAFAAIAQDIDEAGYSDGEVVAIKNEVAFFSEMRAAIKMHAGEELDIKPYEADMRQLINNYVLADLAESLGGVNEYSLVDLIIKSGIHDAIARKLNARGNLSKNAVAEGIINNVRKTIIREQLTDPKFYNQMSQLLEDLIQQRRDDAASYEAFLRKAEALVQQVAQGQSEGEEIPKALLGKRAAIVLYNNLPSIFSRAREQVDEGQRLDKVSEPPAEYGPSMLDLALKIDSAMRTHAQEGWRGHEARESEVLHALFRILNGNREATMAVFDLIKNQQDYG